MRIRSRRGWFAVPLAVALAASVMACGDDDSGGDEASAVNTKEPVKVGLIVAKSGASQQLDEAATQGAQLAIERINEKGGVLGGRPLEAIVFDNKSERSEAANGAVSVIEQGADVVFTSCDFDRGSPSAFVAVEKDLLALSLCAGAPQFGVQGIGPLAFTFGIATYDESALMAEWAYGEKDFRTAYVVRDDSLAVTSTFCDGFEKSWDKLGGEVVGKDTMVFTDASFAAQVSRLADQSPAPDFVLLCSLGQGATTFMRELRAAGAELPILSGDWMSGEYWHEGVPNLSDLYWSDWGSTYGDDPRAEVNDFFATLKDRMPPKDVAGWGMGGYSAVESYAIAVDNAGTIESNPVKEALEAFDDQETLAGPITFTPELHIPLNKTLAVMQLQVGKGSIVKVDQAKDVPPLDF